MNNTVLTIASAPPNATRPGASNWTWRLHGEGQTFEGKATSIENAASDAAGKLSEARARRKFQSQAP